MESSREHSFAIPHNGRRGFVCATGVYGYFYYVSNGLVQKDEEKREYYMEEDVKTELDVITRLESIGRLSEQKTAIEVSLEAFVIYADYDMAVSTPNTDKIELLR